MTALKGERGGNVISGENQNEKLWSNILAAKLCKEKECLSTMEALEASKIIQLNWNRSSQSTSLMTNQPRNWKKRLTNAKNKKKVKEMLPKGNASKERYQRKMIRYLR